MPKEKKQTVVRNKSALLLAKNAIRGTVGDTEAKLLAAVSKAFQEIPERDIPALNAWIDKYPAKRARIYPPRKILKYKGLWPSSFPILTDASRAIRWVSELLAKNLTDLKTFIGLMESFEIAVLTQDYKNAEDILNQIEGALGLSIWLVESRVVLLHRLHGLEAQKEYVRTIHSAAPRSLPSFLAHYTSERNEDSVSFDRYLSRISHIIQQQPVDREIKIYLSNRLVGRTDSESTLSTLSTSLTVASAFSTIDAYEALIETLQAMIQHSELELPTDAIRQCLRRLDIEDWRLIKLRAFVENDCTALPVRGLACDDAYLRGNYELALSTALIQAERFPYDLDALSVAAASYSMLNREPDVTALSALQGEMLTLLTILRSKRGEVAKAVNDISKLLLNIRPTRFAGALNGHFAAEWFEQPQVGRSRATGMFLSSPYLNPRHWLILPRPVGEALLRHCSQSSSNIVTEFSCARFAGNTDSLAGTAEEALLELESMAALFRGDIDRALQAAEVLSKVPKAVCHSIAAKIELHCLLSRGRVDDAIKRTVKYCSETDELRFVAPLGTLLSGKRWKDVRHLRSDISLPILFDLYWRTIDEREHETNRRIAYDEFLSANHLKRPSELFRIKEQYEPQQLVYFLSKVAVPEVMDVSFNAFPSSRAIEEERINICSLLTDLDASHSSIYAEELKNRTTYLNIQDGLRDIDRSRVHVNVEAVARWAEKELKEGFLRYKDLVKAGVGFGSPEEFETMIMTIEGNKATVEQYMVYPEQEGDSLLIDLLEKMANEYLTNSDYGLDAYLSMRIRHGSLAGHLRGPLEQRHLIVGKDEPSGKYEDNVIWADWLNISASAQRSALFNSVRDFSAKYDSAIEELTKNKLQIRRKEKAEGMFFVNLAANPLIVRFVRSHVTENMGFSEFLDLLFAGIEIPLHRNLVDVRDYIIHLVKEKIDGIFEQFRSTLELQIHPAAFVQINSVIADVIPEVQAAIGRVAEWFVPMPQEQGGALRTVDQIVDIGIEVARTAHRGFNPIIDREIEDIGVQALSVLAEFTDILFTLLDNVFRYSGNKESPRVKLRITSSKLGGSWRPVTIRVENEVAPGSYSEAVENKLKRIRQLMASGEYRKHVNLEGGTGLLKLKRLVSLDPRQTLDFGFAGETSFVVEINLMLLVLSEKKQAELVLYESAHR